MVVGQMSFRYTGLPSLPLADRLDRKVLGHRAGQRVGDDQRRRGEIVRLHVRADAAFEIAIARQHGGRNDAVVVDRLRNLLRQWARIADAGGAAEADEIEANLVEIGLQAGIGEIFRDHLAAPGERGLHPRFGLQALCRCIARQQAGADQDAGVGSVGAGGDRRNHDVAMAEIEVAAIDRIALGGVIGLLVFGGERRGEAPWKRRATRHGLRAASDRPSTAPRP